MKELIDKISSYNIFNYLFPGVIFILFTNQFTDYNIQSDNIILDLFLYYFVGLVISRIGSLIIKPLLEKMKIINFKDYGDFIEASKKDSKIELYSEINNMYRTLISTFFMLLFIKGINLLQVSVSLGSEWLITIIAVSLLILFVFAYRKQTDFIKKRVVHASKEKKLE
ncbi:MAG: hypothetical protein M5R37_09765 [Melioribacteraceae bacterium]|nr:hypothetical protein [Melioribacteraceae bacterium]